MTSLRSTPDNTAIRQGRAPHDTGARREGDPGTSAPRTFYVDWADLESKLAARTVRSVTETRRVNRASGNRRLVTTVDREAEGVRANVKDSAKAVLTWLSAVAGHESKADLQEVLERCLRPGPDVQKLNYAAMAREILDTIHVELSVKRIRNAVEHLRRSHEQKVKKMPRQNVKQKLDALQQRLKANYSALVGPEPDKGETLRRSIAADVLTTVRCAAGRLVENDYGEGIPESVDVDQLQDRFLDFVREVMHDGPDGRPVRSLPNDLHGLLVALCDYDGTTESDMQLVVDGSRVVADLASPDSLFGLLAQLNVLVTGRHLLDTPTYCGELLRLGHAAADLHDDPQTRTMMNWVRRLPEDQRAPSPLRTSSYCHNNAATHILERLFKGELSGPDAWLSRAKFCLEQMRRRDSGFRLIKTTEMIYLTVAAKLTGESDEIESYYRRLEPTETLNRLEDLAKFESCAELVQAVQDHVIAVQPQLKHQLIRL